MYDIVNGIAPDYMSNLLEIPPIDHHITRNSTLSFVIPQVSTSGLTSFFYTSARLWNSLPSKSKLSVSTNTKLIACRGVNLNPTKCTNL